MGKSSPGWSVPEEKEMPAKPHKVLLLLLLCDVNLCCMKGITMASSPMPRGAFSGSPVPKLAIPTTPNPAMAIDTKQLEACLEVTVAACCCHCSLSLADLQTAARSRGLRCCMQPRAAANLATNACAEGHRRKRLRRRERSLLSDNAVCAHQLKLSVAGRDGRVLTRHS